MPHRADSSRKRRKMRLIKKDANKYPEVSFDGHQSVEIPLDEDKSPVKSHMSLCSNPEDFKFMDEIALLKRGRINKDAPKHPYDRHGVQQGEEELSFTSVKSASTREAGSPAVMTLMGGQLGEARHYELGNDGKLTHWKMNEGGERYEVATTDDKQITVYQQSEGQTCLFNFKL